MSEMQYGYRFYDSFSVVGPLSRDEVIAKMQEDRAVIPVERHRAIDGIMTFWKDSSDFEEVDGE